MIEEEIRNIKKKVKTELDKERYQHTLGVAYTASCLAMRYREDIKKAYIAGILHDCAKCIPTEKKFKMCKDYGIELTESEKANPALIHAVLGAYLAKKEYNIKDNEIIDSIRTHTTGEPDMSMMQKIIFVADYIEINRDVAPNLTDIREMAFTDINKAVKKILSDTLDHLNTKTAAIDPMTKKTYEFYSKY